MHDLPAGALARTSYAGKCLSLALGEGTQPISICLRDAGGAQSFRDAWCMCGLLPWQLSFLSCPFTVCRLGASGVNATELLCNTATAG